MHSYQEIMDEQERQRRQELAARARRDEARANAEVEALRAIVEQLSQQTALAREEAYRAHLEAEAAESTAKRSDRRAVAAIIISIVLGLAQLFVPYFFK